MAGEIASHEWGETEMSTAKNATLAGHGGAPTFAEALKVWLEIGLLSFGGPAGDQLQSRSSF